MRFYTFYTVILDFFLWVERQNVSQFFTELKQIYFDYNWLFLTIDQEAIHGVKEDFK